MIIELLEKVKMEIEMDSTLFSITTKGEDFEAHTVEKFETIGRSMGIEVTHNGKHAFPDLSVTLENKEIYGIEIKFSALGNWRSKGNSVFETQSNKSTAEGYNEIYVFYGRKPKAKENLNTIEIKLAPYGSSIDRVEVTHSPRFSINMGEEENDLASFFGELTYASFRILDNDVKRERLQKHFYSISEKSGGNKWYLPQLLEDASENVTPTLFSSLEISERDKIIAESFILFPFDLFRTQANYEKVAVNMITNYFVYSTSLRDCFSSQGKVKIFDEEKIKYPQILKRFKDLEKNIKKLLIDNESNEFKDNCVQVWQESIEQLKLEDLNILPQDSLTTSYEKIIANFIPTMKVTKANRKKGIKEKIDLKKFYTIESQ